jgi:hypothetical protein
MAAKKPKSKAKTTPRADLASVKRAAFLAAYALAGNVSEAARRAKVSRANHYEWLQDSDYERAFALAHAEACELLESEARRRAIAGIAEPVVYQGKLTYEPLLNKDGSLKRNGEGEALYSKVPLCIRKYSDVLLIFLMKAAMPHKYRDNFAGEVKDELAKISRGADLHQKLTDEELNTLDRLAQLARSRGDRRGTAEKSSE